MVGIVDPPRPEAKAAIAECHDAGIRVRMITGDHATTAAAIAGELGIEGRAITGAEFAAMSDEQLIAELDEIGVIARVAPEDKVRLVRLLKEKGNVVAMTGDGVNDAPALKTADIGVAMGITGTEVSKEAAVMILTDDNFATIVGAVAYGRTLYDNLLKYLRFQMSTLVAYIAIFIGAGIFGIANGVAAEPAPDPVAQHGRRHPARDRARLRPAGPRPDGATAASDRRTGALPQQLDPALRAGRRDDRRRAGRLPDRRRPAAAPSSPRTMLLTTLSVFHLFGALLSRDQISTIFDRDAFPGVMQLRRYGIALIAIVAITALDFLERIFDTTGLAFNQWCICIGIAASIVVVEEVIKLVLRRQRSTPLPPPPCHVPYRVTRLSTKEHPCRSTSVTAASSRSSTSRPGELRFLLKLSADLKAAKYAGYEQPRLAGKDIALIFEKTSTRTRTAFEVAAKDQGAHVTYLEPSGSQIGHKESMKDTARVLGRTFDGDRVPRLRPGERRDPRRVRRRPGVERPDRRVPPDPDPRRRAHDDRAQRQAPERDRLLLPRRRPQQHGQLADGRRLQVRHGRPALRPARPVARATTWSTPAAASRRRPAPG